MDEKPLLVQLNWNKDDREGRFLLRRLDSNNEVRSPRDPAGSEVEAKEARRMGRVR